MIKIGITGGIGSGKTTVCRIFELLGIPVFYADAVAKTIMHTDNDLRDQLLNEFGDQAYSEDGLLNRKFIASIVFNNAEKLALLNSIVHPAVFKAFDVWAENQNHPYVLKEAALLFESDSYKLCDYSLLVKSPEKLKIERIMRRDCISENDVRSRMNKQLSDDEKEKLSDFIILNDEIKPLIPQVLQLHQKFLTLTKSN